MLVVDSALKASSSPHPFQSSADLLNNNEKTRFFFCECCSQRGFISNLAEWKEKEHFELENEFRRENGIQKCNSMFSYACLFVDI